MLFAFLGLFVFSLLFVFFMRTTAYHLFLKSLYKNTVPIVKPMGLAKESIFLDSRSKEEFEVSHIPDAKWVGFKEFNKELVEGFDKNSEIVVYCSVGVRSEKIGEKLKKMGFTNVKNLYGGIFEYVNLGGELVDREEKRTLNVHTYSRVWSIWLQKGNKIY